MEILIPLIIAFLLVILAWKFLTGIIKTVVLLAILVAAAIFVFGAAG